MDSPEVGLQVPAGTIDRDESPQRAALREAAEETGLTALSLVARLGTREFDARQYGRDEIHVRHFFHVVARGEVPENWRHFEEDPTHGGEPIPFEFFWATLPDGVPDLFADHDVLLDELVRRGWRRS